MEYASFSEAPKHMHFWTAVSTMAGALRRQVWIDMAYFRWHPNFYILLVAPPGIVSKSTTAGIGMSLLRKVPDVKFGPDVVTWQALVSAFAESTMSYEYQGEFHTMSAITIESSEFGNLLNPQDKEMVDLLVSLWDGKPGAFEKRTKGSGNDSVENPWINLIACTTPSWIAGNFPEYMIGGGFTSRCVFVYADKKSKLVAYPSDIVPFDIRERAQKLVDDLSAISLLTGEYKLTPEAKTWGNAWYANHYASKHIDLDEERFGGYLARKQTHVHKLAMILAAAESDRLFITAEHLAIANQMVTDLEPDMQFVFSKIGKSEEAIFVERLIWYVQKRDGCLYSDAYRFVHQHFPKIQDFESVVTGAVRSGYLTMKQRGNDVWLMPGAISTLPHQQGSGTPG
jgi:Protein of unknown function (DUF3987)